MDNSNKANVDVVITTYKPNDYFKILIDRLNRQSVKIDNIFIINMIDQKQENEEEIYNFSYELGKVHYNGVITENDDIMNFDNNVYENGDIDKQTTKIHVKYVTKEKLCEEGTTDLVKSLSTAKYIMYISQNVLPVDKYLIENMLKVFSDEKMAAAYARQLPDKSFNYMEKCSYKQKFSKYAFENMRETAFFGTGDCVLYKAEIFNELKGGTILNEAFCIKNELELNDYKIAGVLKAKVRSFERHSLKYVFSKSMDLANMLTYDAKFLPMNFEKTAKTNDGILLIKYCTLKFMELLGKLVGDSYNFLPHTVKKFIIDKMYSWR